MLIADALRALAPFSLVAGMPTFAMFSASLPTARRSRKANSGAANDGQVQAQVRRFSTTSGAAAEAAAALPSALLQLSLLADGAADNAATTATPGQIPAPTQDAAAPDARRPIDLIRRPRKVSNRRRSVDQPAAPSTPLPCTMPGAFMAVQRCSAQAANDGAIKRYWPKPSMLPRERGMRWAMAGSMADIFAELERLERLERQHAI